MKASINPRYEQVSESEVYGERLIGIEIIITPENAEDITKLRLLLLDIKSTKELTISSVPGLEIVPGRKSIRVQKVTI